MSLADFLKNPGRVTVFLSAVYCLKHLFFWTPTDGYPAVYETPLSGDVSRVFEGERVLTELGYLAGVEAMHGSFYHDRRGGVLYLHPVTVDDPRDAVIRAEIETRVGNVSTVHEGAPYPGKPFSAPVIKIADSAQFGEFERKSSGTLKLANADGRLDGVAAAVPVRAAFKIGAVT